MCGWWDRIWTEKLILFWNNPLTLHQFPNLSYVRHDSGTEASWRHRKHLLLRQTHFAKTSQHRSLGSANISQRTLFFCFDWLVWTSARRWHHVALPRAELTIYTTFISLFRFDHSMSDVNVRYIYQRVGGTQLTVGSHQSKIHKSTALKWQDAQYQ